MWNEPGDGAQRAWGPSLSPKPTPQAIGAATTHACTLAALDAAFRTVGLLLFGVSLTWLVAVVVGRLVARRGLAFWVWNRSGSVGRVLIGLGFGVAIVGMAQGASAAGSSLIALGALLGMAGIWLILPGP